MSSILIVLDKRLVVWSVSVGKTWRRIFSKCVMRATGPESTNVFQDDQLFTGLKVIIGGAKHGVQDIWYSNYSTEYWEFLLVDAKNAFNEIN